MSDRVFSQSYADQYDLLYSDKDYEAECDMLAEVFRRYGNSPIQSLLDLGCGTGNHAIPLAQRGYKVTAVDRSPEMLAHAHEKCHSSNVAHDNLPGFLEDDVRKVDLGKQFDAVLMMFAVLGYQIANADVLNALKTVRRHLKPGGLFVSDVWYGPAVLSVRPSDRVKIVPTSDGKVIRVASTILDTQRQIAQVHYHIWRLGGRLLMTEHEEVHCMRFFFPQEIGFFMTQAGLEPIALLPFGDLDAPVTGTTWNVLAIGRADS